MWLWLATVWAAEPWPPAVDAGTLTVSPEWTERLRAFDHEIEDATKRFPEWGPSVSSWLADVVPNLEAPLVLHFEPVYELNDGVLVSNLELKSSPYKGGYARWQPGSAFIAPDADGQLNVYPVNQEELSPELTYVQADIQLSPDAEWLKADVTATVQTRGNTVLPFSLAVRMPGTSGGFRITEVTQAGVPCAFRLRDGTLAVKPAAPADEITLRIRYEGEAPQTTSDYISSEELILRADAQWLPRPASVDAPFDVVLHHPENFQVFGQGDLVESTTDAGIHTAHWRLPKGHGFTLYGSKKYATQLLKVGRTTLEVAVWEADRSALQSFGDAAKTSMQSVQAVLGDYPFSNVRVVETGWNEGRSGYGALSNVSIGWRSVREGVGQDFLTHELAHGWWGGVVPNAPDALKNGQWNESFAEYTSSLALAPPAAEQLRAEWSAGFASLPSTKLKPIAKVGTASANWEVHHAVTYYKGALVLTALEDRLSRKGMQAFLERLLKTQAGKPTHWDDILGVLQDPKDAEWLRYWLNAASAPDVRLADVAADKRTVSGRLVQGDTWTNAERIQVRFYQEDRPLSVEWLDFQGTETSFSIARPKGATRMVLDPDHRLPRRYDPKAKAVDAGLEASF